MSSAVLDLDDPAAREATVAGAKAAALARARAAGLPALPGVVVTRQASSRVVAEAVRALGESGATPRARLAAMQVRPSAELMTELRSRLDGFPTPLIVRSSSPLEADGLWSGAFSSFHGVARDDLATAVAGTWGSAFSVGVLQRARESATSPEQLGLAVLVQPELLPEVGGSAQLGDDGSVRICWTRGPLRALMDGHVEGHVSVVPPEDSEVSGAELDGGLASQVVKVLRRVHDLCGHHLIEWAAAETDVHLLQSIRSCPFSSSSPGKPEGDRALNTPVAIRVARLTQRFPGRFGHELVLPWAVAARAGLPPPEPSGLPPEATLGVARDLAGRLTAQVWGGDPGSARHEAERVLGYLRGPDPTAALERMEALSEPDPDLAAVLLGLLQRAPAGTRDPDDVEARERRGVDRWEPFTHAVAMSAGQRFAGRSATSGAGAGRPLVLEEGAPPTPLPQGRYVIVAKRPLPSIAPLLWNAAGVVVRASSTAAHVFEFAESVGVPSVVGVELPDAAVVGRRAIIAVDGDQGHVAVL